MIYSKTIKLDETRELEITNLTSWVQEIIEESEIKNGICLVYTKSSTSAITTLEFEEGLKKDFPIFLEKIIPKGEKYFHELKWHDGNGHSHVRAALLKPDLTVPITKGNLDLGTWQQIVFIELDVKTRNREIIVKVLGD
ncbi:MAG: secondary thiamine-phosphate synthase enzyme YjbQ [archaeon]